LIATAKENYPKLKAFSGQVSAAKYDLSGAKTSWLDPFSFQYVSRSNQTNTNAVDVTTADILSGYQFGVSINPGTLLAKPSQIKKARELVRIAESNLAEYNLQLEAEVKTRYFTYLQYKTSLASTVNSYLDVQSTLKDVKVKYQKSEVTLQEYNSASISYNSANLAKIQAETNYLIAKAALEELTVRKLEEIK
ncbi:MAG TPA: TolC family protein, partial [Pedobacter sp.]|nr:TolC family protein [Pedobacter sp.]